ncbi:hypothetical protein PLESTB_001123600 [Pleodorina starrii]|uniref:Sulfatase N-terminal domain-containing protein n=1 Tax=Pleodorina starrii TaxID=330485 RepID=A0A9W6BQR8_9CHLO|nr:hypothetical protein PLESTB_001123600 [Pleodorina starrii]
MLPDDQDYMFNSTHPAYMPALNQHIVEQGLQLRNFLISTAACCPSRTILMTGRYTHNNNVTSNIEPHGSFWKFMSQKLDEDYLPTWLQRAGYRTMHVGKFLNAMDPTDPRFRCPKGWDTWDALVEPYTYIYNTPAFSRNCGPVQVMDKSYSTDVISDKADQYIREAVAAGMAKGAANYRPFYLQVTPIAPHTQCDSVNSQGKCAFPVPARRHRYLFSDALLPMSPNFNIPPPPELGIRDELNGSTAGVQKHYVARLQALKAVDEMIDRLVSTLSSLGQLSNTYLIFTSDNGFQLGNHAQSSGKQFHWEEVVRVPFYIRGPGIPSGYVSDWQGNMVDIAATVMELSGAGVPDIADGTPIPLRALLPSFAYPYTLPKKGASSVKGGQRQLLTSSSSSNNNNKSDSNGDSSDSSGGSGSRRRLGGSSHGILFVESGFEGPTDVLGHNDPDSNGDDGAAATWRRRLTQAADSYNRGMREMMPIEMWGHAWDKRITMKDYRAVRICTNVLAFGTEAEYRSALINGTLGWGDTFYGSTSRAFAGPGLNGGINAYDNAFVDDNSTDESVPNARHRRLRGSAAGGPVDSGGSVAAVPNGANGGSVAAGSADQHAAYGQHADASTAAIAARTEAHVMRVIAAVRARVVAALRRSERAAGVKEKQGNRGVTAGGGAAVGGVSTAVLHMLRLTFVYSQPLHADRWSGQLASTCVYLTAATGSDSCSPSPATTSLATDGLSSVLDAVLVRGAVMPLKDFGAAIADLARDPDQFLPLPYRNLYGIASVTAVYCGVAAAGGGTAAAATCDHATGTTTSDADSSAAAIHHDDVRHRFLLQEVPTAVPPPPLPRPQQQPQTSPAQPPKLQPPQRLQPQPKSWPPGVRPGQPGSPSPPPPPAPPPPLLVRVLRVAVTYRVQYSSVR